MSLEAQTRREIVEVTYRNLMERAALGTIDTANPLGQLSEVDGAWRDPGASWALASSLLALTEQHQSHPGSARERAHTRLVYSVTLLVYDQTRLRRLRQSDAADRSPSLCVD